MSSLVGGVFGWLKTRKERTVRSTVSGPKMEHAAEMGRIEERLDFMAIRSCKIDSYVLLLGFLGL